MNSMFDNYQNISDMYIPSNRPTCPPPEKCCPNLDPCKPTRPYYADYDVEGNLVGYWWYYGNTFDLEFNIEGEYTFEETLQWVPANDFMKGKMVTMNLYNFRREIIYTEVVKADSSKVIFPVNQELSNKLVRGIYYCSLNVSDDTGFDQTVLQMEDCVLNVK